MKSFNSQAFVNQLVVGLLVTIGFGGSIGLGTVWMRHKISVVADTNAALVRQINELDRHIADTEALVEETSSINVLRARNESMRLGLTVINQAQIQSVFEDFAVRRLIARASRRAFERELASSSVGIHFNSEPAPVAATAEASAGSQSTPATGWLALPQSVGAPVRGGMVQFALRP